PIFPPLVQGQYAFKVRAAAVELDPGGVPLTTPTASVSIRRTDDGSGVDLTCVPCGPGETVDVLVAVVATGSRGELRGYAFAGPGCTGEAAESENAAFLFFVPPAAPALELSGPSALLPVRARPPDQLARLELSVEGVAFGP
ncbi:MAG: hypothetical protein GY898_11240, partial [Proteobacteria bacterium]|nr:hypothetical protein [Pseudomonadota bacterium]